MNRLSVSPRVTLGAVLVVLGAALVYVNQALTDRDRRIAELESCVELLERRAYDLETRMIRTVTGLVEQTGWLPDSAEAKERRRNLSERLVVGIATAAASTKGSELGYLLNGDTELSQEVFDHSMNKLRRRGLLDSDPGGSPAE